MGTKRKRPGSEPEETPQDPTAHNSSTTIQRELQARTAIDKGHKLLFRAFKTARGFERQKLGRRRKTASSTPTSTEENTSNPAGSDREPDTATTSAVSRIEAETTALKTLDLTHVTTNYLIKSLLKYKEVASSPSLPGFFQRTAPAPKDPASLNVVARLCNSNPVREVLGGIVRDVTAALGARIHAAGKEKGVKDRKTGKRKDERDGSEQKAETATAAFEDEEDEFQGFDDDVAASSGSDSEADEANVQRRADLLRASLASGLDGSDDEDDEEEAISDEDDELGRASLLRSTRPMSITPSPTPDRDLDSANEPASDLDSASDSKPAPAPRVRALKSGPTTSTTFLPTLTMGGYISGSDSEENDHDDSMARDLASSKPKSNRRGQRARRAIWEAKYGDQAKHLGPGASGAGRDAGWDAKRGATDGRRGFGRERGGGGTRGRGTGAGARGGGRYDGGGGRGQGTDGSMPPKKRVKDDEGPLHPSWVAAKKAKEAKGVVNAPFQGKKVTFD